MFRCSLLLTLLSLLISMPVIASEFDHSHQAFTDVLDEIVVVKGHQSRVRYEQLVSDRGPLDAYLVSLSDVSRSEFDSFGRDEQLAFLINTYNANQLRQVIDHYPIQSIKDVGSFFSSPWSKEFFTLFGKPASLDYVEHTLIRPVFNEPRIHFAVNCASISCPPLQQEAFVAMRLDEQLDEAAINFLSDDSANRLEKGQFHLSKIFDWYEGDFEPGVIEYVIQYRSDWREAGVDASLRFTDYDWNLNRAEET